ncbi:MAG TPA: substrate-binding domain-containing protein [Firmicutes bacterium]|nr:substrate-binding domain-containing protein [Bacillota bacterium]
MKHISKFKKQVIALGMTAVMALGFAACSSNTEGEGDGASTGNFDQAGDITVVSREDGSGTRGAFVELFGIEEEDADGNTVDNTTDDAVIANKTDVMLTNIAGDPQSIGYVSLGSLNDTVKAVTIDGVEATADNVKNESYSAARPFNIATKGEPSELAQDFINYIMSSEGQAIVEEEGYISIDDAAAAFEGADVEGKLVVAGSSSVSPVMEKLAEAYQAVNSNVEIEIQTSDSTAGMTGCIEGTCDIGMASRELKDSETAELTPLSIALDGIAIIVNLDNPIEDLTSDQVKSIYTGETTTWDF